MSKVSLYLLGSGIRGSLQFSVETIQAIKSCRVVYVLHDDLSIHEYVRTLCSDVRDLVDLYNENQVRSDIYREISDLLVAEAEKEPGVAFLVHGHPLFLVSAAEYTLELAREKGLTVRVLPAISSFDTILSDLEIDYGYGLQMFDPTTMITSGWRPNPKIPMLLFQLATTMNVKVVKGAPDNEVLRPLQDYLLESYPPDHRCILIHSAAHVLELSTKIELSLNELCTTEGIELWRRPTLYVPAID